MGKSSENKIIFSIGAVCNIIFMFCLFCFRLGGDPSYTTRKYEEIFYGFTGLTFGKIIAIINYPVEHLIMPSEWLIIPSFIIYWGTMGGIIASCLKLIIVRLKNSKEKTEKTLSASE